MCSDVNLSIVGRRYECCCCKQRRNKISFATSNGDGLIPYKIDKHLGWEIASGTGTALNSAISEGWSMSVRAVCWVWTQHTFWCWSPERLLSTEVSLDWAGNSPKGLVLVLVTSSTNEEKRWHKIVFFFKLVIVHHLQRNWLPYSNAGNREGVIWLIETKMLKVIQITEKDACRFQ